MTRESDHFISFSKEELRFLTVRARQCHYDLFVASAAAPSAARGSLYLVLCISHELERALEVTSEPLLAMIRLTWWREAIEEIVSGKQPRAHELVKPLSRLLEWKPELAQPLFAMIEAHAMELEPQQWSENAAWEHYLATGYGNIIALWANILSSKEDMDIGEGFALIHILRTLPRQQKMSHLRVPEEWRQELKNNAVSHEANQSVYRLHKRLHSCDKQVYKAQDATSVIGIHKAIRMILLSRINKVIARHSHRAIAGISNLPFSLYIRVLFINT